MSISRQALAAALLGKSMMSFFPVVELSSRV